MTLWRKWQRNTKLCWILYLIIIYVLEHLFDNHIFCDPIWCKPLHLILQRKLLLDCRNVSPVTHHQILMREKFYYRLKTEHSELYKQLLNAYLPYTTLERLKESLHPWSAQLNEALNNVVTKYAPKNCTYSATMALSNRIAIVVGVHNMGHLAYWTKVFKLIDLPMYPDLRENLQQLDRYKRMKRKFDSKTEVKRKHMKVNNDKMQILLKSRYRIQNGVLDTNWLFMLKTLYLKK